VGKGSEPAGDLLTVTRGLSVLWIVLALDIALTVIMPRDPALAGTSPWAGGWLSLRLGLHPQEVRGLIGIVCAPFLHAGLGHLAANSLALFLCGWLALKSGRSSTATAVVLAILVSGILTWIIGKPGTVHIGASGVVFGLVGLLVGNALFRKGCLPILVAIPVVLLYGAAWRSMLPWTTPDGMSWEMHLGGFIGGFATSFALRARKD
jgi:membrane associated rhomboid family serine protease